MEDTWELNVECHFIYDVTTSVFGAGTVSYPILGPGVKQTMSFTVIQKGWKSAPIFGVARSSSV